MKKIIFLKVILLITMISGCSSHNSKCTNSEEQYKSSCEENQSDYQEYLIPYNLMKQKRYADAKIAFLEFIKEHPDSKYAANSYFWVGELYYLQGKNSLAKHSYEELVNNYPYSDKYQLASYKIAVINYEAGDKITAQIQLEKIANSPEDFVHHADEKAKEFLENNFQ